MGCACAADAPRVMPRPWRNAKVVTSAGSGLLLLHGFGGGTLGLRAELQTVLYLLVVVVGGYYFGREALEELVKEREVGIERLMAAAAIVAGRRGSFCIPFPGRRNGYTAERARHAISSRHAIRSLMDLAPQTALVWRVDRKERMPVEHIRVHSRPGSCRLRKRLPQETVGWGGEDGC